MASSEDYTKGVVAYSSRDYNSLLSAYKEMIPKMQNLWNPDADSDPGMVLLKLLASSEDMQSTNLDWLANEVFAPSVSQRKDAEKIFGLIGYTLKWYTAGKTEVTFTNASDSQLVFDLGFNGSNFSTLNAYTDITGNSRTITYNILPMTNSYSNTYSRNIRQVVT